MQMRSALIWLWGGLCQPEHKIHIATSLNVVGFTCQMKSKTTTAPHGSLLDEFRRTFKCEYHVVAPLRRFDGQVLKGEATDAETKAKRFLAPVERTWEDHAEQGQGRATCTVSESGMDIIMKKPCNAYCDGCLCGFHKKNIFLNMIFDHDHSR